MLGVTTIPIVRIFALIRFGSRWRFAFAFALCLLFQFPVMDNEAVVDGLDGHCRQLLLATKVCLIEYSELVSWAHRYGNLVDLSLPNRHRSMLVLLRIIPASLVRTNVSNFISSIPNGQRSDSSDCRSRLDCTSTWLLVTFNFTNSHMSNCLFFGVHCVLSE